MESKIKWGLMGSGSIVDKWICGAKQLNDMEIVAISSRTIESAQKMAQKHNISLALEYEALVKRTDIDVVYIPVPHTAHKELAIMAMEHGKSVLVEKPACVNENELIEVLECAKKNNVFFMEGMWTRFFPIMNKIKSLFNDDGIGEVRAMNMAFSFRLPVELRDQRWMNPELAGGGLLDAGVYNLHFAEEILGKYPVAHTGYATIDSDEYHIQVDEQASYIAKYDKGELVVMSSGVRTDMLDGAMIYGTQGYIEVPSFWKPTLINVMKDGKITTYEENIPQKVEGINDEGFQYEIAHVNECIRKNLKESPIMTWKQSLSIIRQCDELRRQWGLKYPFED
ncbi:Predicted dehydrogenase [Bacillus sp. OV166]|uniref:Gfo/Idh/MocA family protein n=1 Tax=Bacillus sp. OV166 TaxID=1882763 RepID=UPI000A2AB2D1|nr:Gfo/Idh/MocA family oxidoreductase [Bacillus sp. OV166]SMQ78488.1 Predicted dehydrogenase [Bacillus sp. OV166]